MKREIVSPHHGYALMPIGEVLRDLSSPGDEMNYGADYIMHLEGVLDDIHSILDSKEQSAQEKVDAIRDLMRSSLHLQP